MAPPVDEVSEKMARHDRSVLGDQGIGKTERHRGVVGPLPRIQAERATADHVRDRSERSWHSKLEGGADGVADREAEQCANRSI